MRRSETNADGHSPRVQEEGGVPDYRVMRRRNKQTRYVVLVPVVNEGERIGKQLMAMAALNGAIDLVVIDGGSTDDSLSTAVLDRTPVRAVVQCERGLSRQLRAGFHFAITEGYSGVVTIDGNGKDSWWDIPKFVQSLDDGVSYAQGSRYIEGGQAINTPPDRAFAVKWIHAPLISLAAGRRYSDTTNGFRAFSIEVLSDPRMAVFRRVFERYSLLFYMTIQASRLGFASVEIPVERRYPAIGSVPTKISGLRGKFAVLTELLYAVSGRYTP